MSRTNVEIVESVHESWSRGDFSDADAFHPEIEFEMVDWPQVLCRGLEAMSSTWTVDSDTVVRLRLFWDVGSARQAAEERR